MLEGQAHNKRTKLMELHGFRKFFDTTITFEAGMSSLYSEMLMGHDVGLKHNYTKPTPQQLLEGNDHNPGYIDAIPFLTINKELRESYRLRNENSLLKVAKPEYEWLREELALQSKDIEEYKELVEQCKRHMASQSEEIYQMSCQIEYLTDLKRTGRSKTSR